MVIVLYCQQVANPKITFSGKGLQEALCAIVDCESLDDLASRYRTNEQFIDVRWLEKSVIIPLRTNGWSVLMFVMDFVSYLKNM